MNQMFTLKNKKNAEIETFFFQFPQSVYRSNKLNKTRLKFE